MKLEEILTKNKSGTPFKNSYNKYEYLDVLDIQDFKNKNIIADYVLEDSIHISTFMNEEEIETEEVNTFVETNKHYLQYIEKYVSDRTIKRAIRTGDRKVWESIKEILLFVDKVKNHKFNTRKLNTSEFKELIKIVKEYITWENIKKYYKVPDINSHIIDTRISVKDKQILSEIRKRRFIGYNIEE